MLATKEFDGSHSLPQYGEKSTMKVNGYCLVVGKLFDFIDGFINA